MPEISVNVRVLDLPEVDALVGGVVALLDCRTGTCQYWHPADKTSWCRTCLLTYIEAHGKLFK